MRSFQGNIFIRTRKVCISVPLRLKSASYTFFFSISNQIGFQKNNFRKTCCKQPGSVQKTVFGIAMIKKSLLLFPDITLLGLFKIWECLLYGCYIYYCTSKDSQGRAVAISRENLLILPCGVKQFQALTLSNLKGCP